MNFTPRSESEVSPLFEKGIYKFRVESAVERTSKNGNPMIELKLKLVHNMIQGKTILIYCYLLTDNPSFDFLLRHFCYSVGLGESYEKGVLEAAMCPGKVGTAKIGIDIDKEGKYQEKNKVLDFIMPKEGEVLPQTIDDDDVPF